ncbi:ATP-binding cassette domain-containing protein [Candidatus Gracilibacteria bacterium]|nr:ATP-binding cassette domain-containing protein [Candidatus Gracilibacteria bacterium]
MFHAIWRIILILREKKAMIFSLTFVNLVFAILVIIEPIFFKQIIDTLISFDSSGNKDFSSLIQILLFWLGVGISIILLRIFVTIYGAKISHDGYTKNITSFFTHVQNLSMRFHMDTNSGELVKKITRGVDGLLRTHLDIFRRITPSAFTLILLIPVVLYANIKLGLFVIIVSALSSIITYFVAKKTFHQQAEIEDIYSGMSTLYGDTFSNMMIIKSFSLKNFKNRELQAMSDLRIAKQYPILNWWGIIMSFSQVLKIIVSIGVIFFGSYLYLNGEVSIGEIVMFLSFSLIFLSAIEDLTWTFESIFWNIAPIEQYFEILDTKQEVQDRVNARELSEVKGNVVFENLEFSYDGKRTVLKDISLDIKPGEKVAFVGHTGSGKTTMTNMLLRFFEPQKGKVLIDGTDISEATQDSLRRNIGVVFQDNSLFNTTIEKNIRLDNEDATREDIQRVAEKSHASDFIANLSDGLDTVVGERGVKLSGGEKQRLAIARAFLKDAPILVLDEATSALDAETERYLQASFDELMKGRTTFIIAHRLSTIKKADRIFVFDSGRIIEQGSYQDLVSQKGAFARLVAAQVEGFIE